MFGLHLTGSLRAFSAFRPGVLLSTILLDITYSIYGYCSNWPHIQRSLKGVTVSLLLGKSPLMIFSKSVGDVRWPAAESSQNNSIGAPPKVYVLVRAELLQNSLFLRWMASLWLLRGSLYAKFSRSSWSKLPLSEWNFCNLSRPEEREWRGGDSPRARRFPAALAIISPFYWNCVCLGEAWMLSWSHYFLRQENASPKLLQP